MLRQRPFLVEVLTAIGLIAAPFVLPHLGFTPTTINRIMEIGRAVQQECRDRYRMPSSAWKKKKKQTNHASVVDSASHGAPTRRRRHARRSTRTAFAVRGQLERFPCFFCALFFFFNDTATTEIYTLSLHDALPICQRVSGSLPGRCPPTRCRSSYP